MIDYIERNELIENLKYFAPEHYSGLIDNLIMKQPAADVEPVKHGYWAKAPYNYLVGICSVCRCEPLNPSFRAALYNYCPNCGAKMDGENL